MTKSLFSQLDKRLLILVLIIFAILVRLGFWQIDRASEKKAYKQHVIQQLAQAPQALCQSIQQEQINDDKKSNYQLVTANIELTNKIFIVDNQKSHGKLGYEILQLARTCDQMMFISRGFEIANVDRSILPQVNKVTGQFEVVGYLAHPPASPYTQDALQQDFSSTKRLVWPKRVIEVNIADVEKMLEMPAGSIYPQVLRITQGQLLKEAHWKVLSMTPARHYGYAFQWFLLAFILLALYYVLVIRSNSDN